MWWCAALLLFTVLRAGAGDASLRWEQLCDASTCSAAPPARRGHGAVAHVAGKQVQMVIHGGFSTGAHGAALDDVWALRCSHLQRSLGHWGEDALSSREGCRWTQLCDAENCGAHGTPSPRMSHSLVMSGETDVLVFGGYNPATKEHLADVWGLTLGERGHVGWQRLCAPTSKCAASGPGARSRHAAAALGATSMVVHGGAAPNGTLLRDLWLFVRDTARPEEGTWVAVAEDNTGPPALAGHSLVMTSGNAALLYGGRTGDGNSAGDVWLLSLAQPSPTAVQASWRRLCGHGACSPSPTPRYDHAAVAVGDDMYVFGGVVATGSTAGPGRDLWRFTVSLRDAPHWTELCPQVDDAPNACGEPPFPRSMHSLVAFPGGELMVFGGATAAQPTDEYHDVWQLGTTPPMLSPLPRPSSHAAHAVWLWMPLLAGLAGAMSLVVGVAYNVVIARKSGLAAVPHYQWASSVVRRVSTRLAWLFGGQAPATVDANPLLADEGDPDAVDWTDFEVDDEANYL
eukprot:EG_transcript_9170